MADGDGTNMCLGFHCRWSILLTSQYLMNVADGTFQGVAPITSHFAQRSLKTDGLSSPPRRAVSFGSGVAPLIILFRLRLIMQKATRNHDRLSKTWNGEASRAGRNGGEAVSDRSQAPAEAQYRGVRQTGISGTLPNASSRSNRPVTYPQSPRSGAYLRRPLYGAPATRA
jgi:hypothetical protein